MGKFRNSQAGFTAVEGLLIVLVLAVIGFGGYYVWHTQQSKDTTTTTSAKSTTPTQYTTTKTTPIDPTANWTAFSTKAGGFSLKYPQGWYREQTVDTTCGSTSDDELLSLVIGPTKDTAGRCATGGQGEVLVAKPANNSCLLNSGRDNIVSVTSSRSVEVSGSQATKYVGTTKAEIDMSGDAFGPVGTKLVEYCFTNGVDAMYAQHPGWSDVESDFEQIVTSTLKFQ